MKAKISNKVVSGGPSLMVPAHLSLGQHVIDKLRENIRSGDMFAMINYDTGHKITYKQLLQEIVSVATGLKIMGTKKGDVIGICSENINEYITAVLAIICCGATVTTANIMYSEEEIRNVLNISQPNIILCSEVSLKRNINIFKSIPFINKIIQLNGSLVDEDIIPYKDVMASADMWTFEPTEVEGWRDIVFILFSSGTTGMPKGVMLTHLNVLYAMECFNTGYTAEVYKKILTVLPLYHAYGLNLTIQYLLRKKLIVYMVGFQPEKYLKAIEEHKIQVLLTVPPIIIFLVKSPIVTQYDTSSVNAMWCGAAPLTSEITKEALQRMPNCKGIYQGYGLTECTLGVIKDYEDNKTILKTGSCGYPVPGIKIKVVDIKTRQKLGAYESGEVCIKGPVVMKGYVKNELATLEIIDQEGYLKTGDIGYYEDDGRFYIVDRLKELIKYKGTQVAPAVIEQVLFEHNEVADCGVVGMPDELAGELPVAFVVIKPSVKLTESELLHYTDQRLSHISRLRGGIIFVDTIPRSPSGKVLRKILKDKFKK